TRPAWTCTRHRGVWAAESCPPRARVSLARLEVTTMPLSFPRRAGPRHRSPRAEDLPDDATLFVPRGLPRPERGLPPARRPGPAPPHGASPPQPAPKSKGGQPLLYWRPVAAAGVLTVALVIVGATALKPANPPASPKERGPAPSEAQPPALARRLHGTSVAF